jgi:tetratricopeptide (TPR) repeat protein
MMPLVGDRVCPRCACSMRAIMTSTRMKRMDSTIRKLAAISSLAIMLATARIANADDPLAKPTSTEAQGRLTTGNRLYRMREFEKAIDEYKAGSLKEDAPVFLYNLAQCYRQLGRYEDAIWHYERFLDRAKPTGQVKDAIDGFLRQMKDELAQRAKTELPTDVAPSTPEVQEQKAPPQQVTVRPSSSRWYSDRVGWVIAGAGVTAGIVSGVLLLQASDLRDDADSATTATEAMSLRDKADRRSTIAVGFAIGGAALLIVGGIKLALHSDDVGQRTSLRLGISANGAYVVGSF